MKPLMRTEHMITVNILKIIFVTMTIFISGNYTVVLTKTKIRLK